MVGGIDSPQVQMYKSSLTDNRYDLPTVNQQISQGPQFGTGVPETDHDASPFSEEPMDTVEGPQGTEQTPGYDEVLDWLQNRFPETAPQEESAPRDRLLNRLLRGQLEVARRREVRLPRSDFYGQLDTHFSELVQGRPSRQRLPLPPGSFFLPGRLSEVYQWRDEPHVLSKQQLSARAAALMGHAPPPKSFTFSSRDFDQAEAFARRQLLTTNAMEWQLALVLGLLDEEEPDLTKVQRVISSLALGLNQLQMDSLKSVANFFKGSQPVRLRRREPPCAVHAS